MSERTIFEIINCKGKLSWSDSSLEIEFKLSCGRDGSLAISPNPIPISPQSKFLFDLSSTRSRTSEKFIFFGLGPDREQIETKSAYLTHFMTRSNAEGSFIDLEISTHHLEIRWQHPQTSASREPIHLEYLVPGLRGFGSTEVEAPFGKVRVAGATEVEHYTELTGIVTITAMRHPNSSEATQLEELDARVRRLLDVLSLAEGRFMQWSIRRIVAEGQVRSAVFRGPMDSSEPRFPLFSFLNLPPVVKIAVEQYTEELCKATGVDVAIEWFLMHPQYAETQFLTGMTALEHLIHVFGKQHPQGGMLPRNIFKKKLRPRLQDALDNAFKALPAEILSEGSDALEVMSRKFGDLNRRTLRTNLEALLKHHGVPISDIETEIPSLISLRNHVIHRGHQSEADGSQALSYSVAVLRELLTRVFLSLFRYRGTYQSFLNGPEWRQFPPDQA
jgi:hypothetical protein